MRTIALLFGLVMLAGCTSFHTTMVSRLENDSLVKDPCQQSCLKGVPVKLKVPSHVIVRIYEEQVLAVKLTKSGEKFVLDPQGESRLISFDTPQLRVETELSYTDKVFLVDFQRPAAGVLSLVGANGEDAVKFDNEQYFSRIKATAEERTIRDITGVIGTFPNTTSATKTASQPVNLPPGVSTQQALVAFKRFDIAEPGWEHQMHEFIDQHLCLGPTIGAVKQCPATASVNPSRRARSKVLHPASHRVERIGLHPHE